MTNKFARKSLPLQLAVRLALLKKGLFVEDDFDLIFQAIKNFFFTLGERDEPENAEEAHIVFYMVSRLEHQLAKFERKLSQKISVFRKNFCYNSADGINCCP